MGIRKNDTILFLSDSDTVSDRNFGTITDKSLIESSTVYNKDDVIHIINNIERDIDNVSKYDKSFISYVFLSTLVFINLAFYYLNIVINSFITSVYTIEIFNKVSLSLFLSILISFVSYIYFIYFKKSEINDNMISIESEIKELSRWYDAIKNDIGNDNSLRLKKSISKFYSLKKRSSWYKNNMTIFMLTSIVATSVFIYTNYIRSDDTYVILYENHEAVSKQSDFYKFIENTNTNFDIMSISISPFIDDDGKTFNALEEKICSKNSVKFRIMFWEPIGSTCDKYNINTDCINYEISDKIFKNMGYDTKLYIDKSNKFKNEIIKFKKIIKNNGCDASKIEVKTSEIPFFYSMWIKDPNDRSGKIAHFSPNLYIKKMDRPSFRGNDSTNDFVLKLETDFTARWESLKEPLWFQDANFQ